MVSKKLTGTRKLLSWGPFLAVTLSSSARLQAAAVSKEEQSLRQPLIRKNIVTESEYLVEAKSKYLGAGTRCAKTRESVYEGKPVT